MKIFLKTIIIIAVFALGASSGYYWKSKRCVQAKSEPAKSVVGSAAKTASEETSDPEAEERKKKMGLKVGLLQDYINLILLPKEEIIDPHKYANDMQAKADGIGDAAISEKFEATSVGDENERSSKILEFLNLTFDSIKSDLAK